MKSALLVLALFSAASAAEPAKKRVKAAPQASASAPAARIELKKVVFGGASDGLTRSGGADITGGGESILGAGISRGAADKPGSANAATGGGGGGGGGGSAGSTTTKSFEKAKVLVSNSPSGPFTQNGTVCSEGQVYTRTTGLDRTKPPMGCASPFESNDCLDTKNHRKFEPGEWLDPFTIQTVVTGSNYPQGKYGMYLSYSKTDVKRVGFATLKSCAPAAPPAPAVPPGCRWETHNFVVGPCYGPGCSSSNGNCSTPGATGQGGGGTWTCVCH